MQPDRTSELSALLARRLLILDGAMGTMIQRHGLQEADYRGERLKDHPHDLLTRTPSRSTAPSRSSS